MTKMFTDDLPKWGSGGKAKEGSINWKMSIGCIIKFIYDNIQGEIEILDYHDRYLYVKYLDKAVFKIFSGSFMEGKIGSLLGEYTQNFKVEIGDSFKDDKRDMIILDREYRVKGIDPNIKKHKFYKYRCNKCGFCDDKSWIDESSLLRGHGCKCCRGTITVESINDITTTAPFMAKFFQNIEDTKTYTYSSSKKIYPICPDCGRVKDKPMAICDIYRRHSIGCSCSDGHSYPNKFMYELLKQLNIEFEPEFSPIWIRPRRYDFYFKLNNKEYIVEMDGGLGHGKKVHSKSKITTQETLDIDNYKDNLAKEHNIEPIRIECDISELEYIKDKIIYSKLNVLFDLKLINWIKCEEYALKNLVLEACEMKRDNPNMSTRDIGEVLGIWGATVRNYLIKGLNIWNWFEYNPHQEQLRITSKNLCRSKKVQVFKENKMLGTFESATELVEKSKELFGVQFLSSKISLVCNGKNKQHKGYTFKYPKDITLNI